MWALERAPLRLARPVGQSWPGFAAEGKADLPVRWLLTHEAGLSAIGTRMPFGSLSDWDAMTAALAAQAPWWEPGSGHGYHGVTFGHLVGEVLRRATGRTVGQIVRDELGLDLVQVSLDLVDVTRGADTLARDVDEHVEAVARYGIAGICMRRRVERRTGPSSGSSRGG